MKKVLALMAFAAAMFVSCDINDPDDPDNPGGGGNYKAPIVIDGDFADWAKLDAGKVIELKCAATAAAKDLKLAKIYADKYFVYIYVEFNFSAYDGDVKNGHFHFYFNSDNNTETGAYEGEWDQGETPCIDVMAEGDVITEGALCDNYDPTIYTWEGPVHQADWDDAYWVEAEANMFATGKGTKKAFEFRITRELCPGGKLAKTFTMGMDICVNGWDASGALPNTDATDTNPAGRAPLVTVSI